MNEALFKAPFFTKVGLHLHFIVDPFMITDKIALHSLLLLLLTINNYFFYSDSFKFQQLID